MSNEHETYYVPEESKWPFVGAVALFFIAFGAGNLVNEVSKGVDGYGGLTLAIGLAIIIYMLFGWFKDQINESMAGMYSAQLDESYRQGMAWFIFSEVMFFFAFFGGLFYARMLSVPWLGGDGWHEATGSVLWQGFEAVWPVVKAPDGTTSAVMGAWGLPAINTIILVVSSFTLHIAHHSLETDNNRGKIKLWLGITILLGITFLGLQVYEYIHAYAIGLTLDSGIYGNTFFMLTGFHGMHVTLGTIILIVCFFRILKGHFTPENHFAFMAGSWYWHFVDVVWLLLFVFVYVL